MATFIVSGGKALLANRVLGLGAEPKFAGWGTGAGTATAVDTDLFTPATESRVSGTSSRVTTSGSSVSNDTYQVVATITADATKTITNAGLWDAAGSGSPPTGGGLFLKGDFPGIALNAAEGIVFTFQARFT